MAGHIESSGNVTWRTPGSLVVSIRDFFDGEIDLDPCAAPDDIPIAEKNIRLPEDGLAANWGLNRTFCNPPFGTNYVKGTECISASQYRDLLEPDAVHWRKQTISQWVEKADTEHRCNGTDVVMLIPAAVETIWWQQIIFPSDGAAGVCLMRGRVKFIGAAAHAPMATALVYFGERQRRFRGHFQTLGYCLVMP